MTVMIGEYLYLPANRIAKVNYESMPEVYKYLETSDSHATIIDYPFLAGESPRSYEYRLWRRLYDMNLFNEKYSQTQYNDIRQQIINPVSQPIIDELRQYGINYIIIHKNKYLNEDATYLEATYNNNQVPDLKDLNNIEYIDTFQENILYKIKN